MSIISNVKSELLRELRIIRFVLELISVIFAVLFCGFNIYFHINEQPYLIAYSILGGLSLLYFLYFVFLSEQFDKKDNRYVKRLVRYLKIATRGVLIVYSIIELASGTLSVGRVIFTIITLVIFIIRILFELFLILMSQFLKDLKVELKNEYNDKINVLKQIKDKTTYKYNKNKNNYNNEKNDDDIIDIKED